MQTKLEKAAAAETRDILGIAEKDGTAYQVLKAYFEKGVLAQVMRVMDGNQTKAAQWLGINRMTLRSKLRRYDML